MQNLEVLNVLFYAVMFFVGVNSLLSWFLWSYSRKRIYALTLKFWLSNILYLGFQFFFPHNEYEVVLVFGLGIIPMIIAYSIVCEVLNRKPKYKHFVIFGLLSLSLTLVLLFFQTPFTVSAMPFTLALAFPLVAVIKHIFYDHRNETTLLQRVLGGLFIFWIIQCFNFAFFRMVPNTQVFGWITVYALYDVLAIILPAIAIENHLKNEKRRLQQLVQERTTELSTALSDKENLVKILIHDISNPLTVMRWYLNGIKNGEQTDKYIDKIYKSQEIVESIVKKVKALQNEPKTQKVTAISLMRCIDEVKFVFEKSLEEKKIHLEIKDTTRGNDRFIADQFTFSHNILSNFISNAIKFSYPNSTITLLIKRVDEQLVLVIKDQGVGMNAEMIQQVLDDSTLTSSAGTNGEVGTGYGLGIAKSMLSQLKGKMDISSEEFKEGSLSHGTMITLTFPPI